MPGEEFRKMRTENAALPSSLSCCLCQVVSHGGPCSWNLDSSIDFGIPYAVAGHKVQADLTIALIHIHVNMYV